MNDKNINLSDYTISVRIGHDFQYIDLDVFTAFCDRFLYEELVDLLAQSPTNSVFYSCVRNKVRFVLQISPKID